MDKISYNHSDIDNENIKLSINIKLKDIRLLSRYLENEVIIGLNNILTQLENNSETDIFNNEIISFYNSIYDIFYEIAEVVYRGMIEKEKIIIDKLKKQGLTVDEVITIVSKDFNDEDRIINIYQAVNDLELEKEEAHSLKILLPSITKKIMDRLSSDISSLYMPLVIKFISFLSNTTRNYSVSVNEAIFAEGALEELLDLHLDALELFLQKLCRIKIKIDETEGFLVNDFTIYNNTTLSVQYNTFITNPNEYQKYFSILNPKNVKVSLEA